MTATLYCGDCLEVLPTLAAQSIDAIITDPPYPEINREYGRMSEADWWAMMMGVCAEARRVLKPMGSAVFILQPNSRKVGSMRGWLWEFMAWVCREWNMVQDAYWWNTCAAPTVHARRTNGLMRPSSKLCVWAGAGGCYRNQEGVLLPLSDRMKRGAQTLSDDLVYKPSGAHWRDSRVAQTTVERGGATPFNVLAFGNGSSSDLIGRDGHGAGTPLELAKWWTRYICPPGGTVLDPFVGSGTMMLAAMEYGCNGIGIDKMGKYIEIAQTRVDAKQPAMSFAEAAS